MLKYPCVLPSWGVNGKWAITEFKEVHTCSKNWILSLISGHVSAVICLHWLDYIEAGLSYQVKLIESSGIYQVKHIELFRLSWFDQGKGLK